ncbi:MAG: DJ-1/PfpI family protein, partial [Thermoplasmata archaeon]
DNMRRHKEIVDFIKEMNKRGKVIGAICHGPWILASAEIIKDKKVTSFYSIKDDILHAGGIYTGNPVEIDGNIITGTDPSALPQMMKEFIKMLKLRP